MRKFKIIIILVLILGLFAPNETFSKAKKTKTKAKTSLVKSKIKVSSKDKSKKDSKKSKKIKKKKRSKSAKSVSLDLSVYDIVKIDTLGEGTVLKKYVFGKGSKRTVAEVVEMDAESGASRLAVGKALGKNSGLAKAYDIASFYDSVWQFDSYAAVNANFWKAYSNRAISPLISNGEVIEKESYKAWTSGFFDANNKLYIDRFKISGAFYRPNGKKLLEIENVNYRPDSKVVVLYNKYFGDTIPKPYKLDVKEAIKEALSDTLYSELDSTEDEIDVEKVENETRTLARNVDIEETIKKMSLRYLIEPTLNKDIKCVVEKVDTGCVAMPKRGCVISLGQYGDIYVKKGDTLILRFDTDKYSDVEFTGAVSGTPRLVRNGVAKHEAMEEGSKAARFIKANLPRTAVGVNKENTKIYVVAFPCYIAERSLGVNLEQESTIMKKIGAYNAFNLDGGGSTSMAINGENICSAEPKSGRKVSAALIVGAKRRLKAEK